MAAQALETPIARKPGMAWFGYHALTWAPLLVSSAAFMALGLPWIPLLFALFLLRLVNGFVVTALYHRCAAHRSVDLHPAAKYAMRAWGWLFVGLGVRTWAGVHRVHHGDADGPGAWFSPSRDGFFRIGRDTIAAHWAAVRHPERIERFVPDLPVDALERWIQADERRFFGAFGVRMAVLLGGLTLTMTALSGSALVGCFGAVAALPGITGALLSSSLLVVNGLGHLVGERRFATDDTSTNVVRFDALTLGEALHNNHHARPRSACFAAGPGDFDGAWPVLLLLRKLGAVTALR